MTRPGRNALCPCGSGKKFKHCCDKKLSSPLGANLSHAGALHASADECFSRAMHLHAQGQYESAIEQYRKGLSTNPASAKMLVNLGGALDSTGRIDEAMRTYREALAINPALAEAHNNLALLIQGAQPDLAIKHYRQAITLQPNFVAAHFNLGRLSILKKDFHGAIEHNRRVLELDPDNAQASNNLGESYEALGNLNAALCAYRNAVAKAPDLLTAKNSINLLLGRLVPLWHVPMMNDERRNAAYQKALSTAITPVTNVLEIGTGSGLLSMMAAQAGAKEITTCEAEPLIAQAAQEIIAANGLATRIKVIHKKSSAMRLGDDLHEPADLLVSEIFSSELLGEHVLSSIEDAKRRLLKSDAKVIPAVASIMIAPFGGKELEKNLRVENVMGFSLEAFNKIVPQRQAIFRDDLQVALLSASIEAFSFDFQAGDVWPAEEKTFRVPIQVAGRCLGIIQWIHLKMDENTSFENHPSIKSPASSWTRCVYLLPEPVDVRVGQQAVIRAAHNRTFPWFSLHVVE